MLQRVLHRFLRDAIQMVSHLELDRRRNLMPAAKLHLGAAQGAALRQELERALETAVGVRQRGETLHDAMGILDAARGQQSKLIEIDGNDVALPLCAI